MYKVQLKIYSKTYTRGFNFYWGQNLLIGAYILIHIYNFKINKKQLVVRINILFLITQASNFVSFSQQF